MLVPYEDKYFLEEAREDVTEQFKGKEVFDKFLQILIDSLSDVEEAFKQLLQERSIDEAVGEQLDVIGRIVGQPRNLISLELYEYFAFQGYPAGDTFGDLNDPSIGGYFYSLGSPSGGNYLLDDNTYRLFIKSKTLKNRTASTPEELIGFLSYIFGGIPIYLEEGRAHLTINFGRNLSTFEKNLLSYVSYSEGYPSRLIPKTIGVSVEYSEFNNDNFFAFDGVPNAKGFGDAFGEVGWGDAWGEDWGGTDPPVEDGGYFASYV